MGGEGNTDAADDALDEALHRQVAESALEHTSQTTTPANTVAELNANPTSAPLMQFSRELSAGAKEGIENDPQAIAYKQQALNEVVDTIQFYQNQPVPPARVASLIGRSVARYHEIQGGGDAFTVQDSWMPFMRDFGKVAAAEGAGMLAGAGLGKLAIWGGRALRGVIFRARPPAVNPGGGATGAGAGAAVGEPVSVTNGEYLETWRDFNIPGTFAFNGARYMGLKLGLPGDYDSPLGACQISMFDEIVSNPQPGWLSFHDAEGRRIWFERPFNFLSSVNESHPNLELKAPWLKQLTLRDGRLTRHFRQYPDRIYRLEKITDLNGFEFNLRRAENGWLERADGPDGLSLVFGNNDQGLRTHISLIGTDGSELELATYTYDARRRMTSANCAFGMSVSYQWHDERDLLKRWHDATRTSVTDFTYDDDGRVVHTATNGIWNNDRLRYDGGETIYLPGGQEENAFRFRYDEADNITAEIDALGGMVEHRYSSAGLRVATKNANGDESRTKYDRNGNVGEHVDAEGRSTVYVWGDHGDLRMVIDAAGNRRRYEHDHQSNVIMETDAEGHVTRLSRDDKGRVTAVELPNGAVERRVWDDFNRLVSITDAKNNTSSFEYDVFNRLVALTDPLGKVTRREYQSGAGGFDMMSRLVRPDGAAVSRSFDGQAQLASVTDGEGRTWSYRAGAFGTLQSITDPKGGVISFDYDVEGRVLGITNAVGCDYRYVRDLAGRVVEEEDFDGRVTKYHRDAGGKVTEKIKPDGARLTYAYDKSGLVRRIESFDAAGKSEEITRFWYDGRGLLTRAENRAALVEFERDRNGRITGETLNGKRIRSKRDALGNRIMREIVGSGGGVIDYVRDPLGAVEKLTFGDTEIVFRRDALGQETRREAGGFSLAQRYDDAGQLVAQAAGGKSPVDIGISRLGWNVPQGEGARKRGGAVSRVYEYDRAFAPLRIDDSLWGEQRFDYDNNGQLVGAEGSRGSEQFSYDDANNVVGASSAAPFSSVSAGYGAAFDAAFGMVMPAGRPSSWQRSLGGVVSIARGPKGEKVRLRHDDCGRLIERVVDRDGFRPQRWSYQWNAHDRLASVTHADGESWLFNYDPFGRRVSKVRRFSLQERERAAILWPTLVNGEGEPQGGHQASNEDLNTGGCLPVVGTTYLWDGAHMVAEAPLRLDGYVAWGEAVSWHFEGGESDDQNASHRLIAKQLPVGAVLPDGSVLETSRIYPVVCDHLGTPKEMFDDRGDVVWSVDHHVWGEVRAIRSFGSLAVASEQPHRSEALTCPWRFPGQYEDAETGLFYNRHRHYDPLTAQYASPDPIGLHGGDRPQGYVPVPSIHCDPLGLAAEKGVLAAANFAQNNRILPTKAFSDVGQQVLSRIAGQPIKTVGDLTAALRSGKITPSQIPVDYVKMNDTILILNTRTSTALTNAGIPKQNWFGRNQTGVQVPNLPAGTTFNDLAADQLRRNSLGPQGAANLPIQ